MAGPRPAGWAVLAGHRVPRLGPRLPGQGTSETGEQLDRSPPPTPGLGAARSLLDGREGQRRWRHSACGMAPGVPLMDYCNPHVPDEEAGNTAPASESGWTRVRPPAAWLTPVLTAACSSRGPSGSTHAHGEARVSRPRSTGRRPRQLPGLPQRLPGPELVPRAPGDR